MRSGREGGEAGSHGLQVIDIAALILRLIYGIFFLLGLIPVYVMLSSRGRLESDIDAQNNEQAVEANGASISKLNERTTHPATSATTS